MGSKRGIERIESVRQKLYDGMARNGLVGAVADDIYAKIQAFANFGFAESHSLSFALLVYASSWLKLHYPGAFLAALLRAQPMGFYSPATLTADARRHGVVVRRPDLHASGVDAGLEPLDADSSGPSLAAGAPVVERASAASESKRVPTGIPSCTDRHQPPVPPFDIAAPDASAAHRRDAGHAVRLGLAAVTRDAEGPFRDLRDLVRRTGATAAQVEALATAGTFESMGISRREGIWLAGDAAQDLPEFLPGSLVAVQPPLFGDPSTYDVLAADLWATGISTDDHPLTHYRAPLDARGVLTSRELRTHEVGRRVEVAGLVTHRQRPATASGITFINLEDEHGLVNVICSKGVWDRYRRVLRDAPALIARGMLERSPEGVTNLVADAFEDLRVGVRHRSRDFR